MPDRTPIKITNLDIYGNQALPWSRPQAILTAGIFISNTILSTVRPDGRPHATGIGAIWLDGEIYFTSGPDTRKARNLAHNSACTITARMEGIDLMFEGEALRVYDRATLELAAARCREGGWPVEVAGDAFTGPYSAPSAGPPPWNLYRFSFDTVIGNATAEPHGATRWRFERSDGAAR
jgi:hypothetical protein